MSRARRRRFGLLFTAFLGATAIAASPMSWAQSGHGGIETASQRQSLQAGVQVAPKAGAPGGGKITEPNPYLANGPQLSKVDYSSWQRQMASQAATRATSAQSRAAKVRALGRALPAPLVHHETEPSTSAGQNDTRLQAEPLTGFGTGRTANPRVRVLGSLADSSVSGVPIQPGAEDNSQLSRANDSTIDGSGAVSTTGVIGDGDYGSSGSATNDFDFYRIRASAGKAITIDTSGSTVDTVVALYAANGELLGANDDFTSVVGPSRLVVPVGAGTYYAMVAGYSTLGSLPSDPEDAQSGAGNGSEGSYDLAMSASVVDADFYGLDLAKGDVIGATVSGSVTSMTVYRPDGLQMVGSTMMDASSLYPPQSPLTGGGNTTFAYVAERAGRYAVQFSGSSGSYDATVEAYRPAAEVDPAARQQTVFLDFDGARVNTAIWGGPGVRTLSPFRDFITKWGFTPGQETALIRTITERVRENIQYDLAAKGLNTVAVRVVNSRDHVDDFGDENVSRVIVGGTIAESGIETIGVAQFIDPGNFAHEDSAVVLLDVLSDTCDASSGASLNCYLSSSGDRAGFFSRAMSNVISHEIGHLLGNYHTDNDNAQHSLMDAGGANFQNLYGVGPDGVGGTADDEDVDFALDTYLPAEGFTGQENTLNVAAWGYTKSQVSTGTP